MFVKFNCTLHKFKSGMKSYSYSHNQKTKFTEEALRKIYDLEYDEDLSIEFDPSYICDKYEFFSCVEEFNAYFNTSKMYTPSNHQVIMKIHMILEGVVFIFIELGCVHF